MQTHPIKFGTDGWRGIMAADFTFANVRRVAQATADYWNSQPLPRHAVVGYDNRFQAETFARLTAEVLAANGILTIYAATAAPTPSISYAVRARQLCGAVMITASHNPPQFNGYKIKAHYAGSADPEICAAIEAHLDKSPVRALDFEAAVKAGQIEVSDPRRAHIGAVKKIVDLGAIRAAGLRVVIDSMHGSGTDLLASVLAGGKCRTTNIRADRNPLFGGINPEPIGKNLAACCAAVRAQRADVGLATDGDADRLGIVDERGRYLSIQLVFALLLLHTLRQRQQTSGLIVRSTNCTMLIDRIARHYGLPLAEVPVGFKWICQKMRETDVLIGGEESGGIGFRGHIPERDGILACLMFLEMLATTGQSVTELARSLQKEFGQSAYDRIDTHYPLEKRQLLLDTLRREPPTTLDGVAVAHLNAADGVKYIAADDSWLMFRASGNEPIVRIYCEAPSAASVQRLLDWGRQRAASLL
jgi:alpha-D-glucose phosphate-specific phosphoglucomutase